MFIYFIVGFFEVLLEVEVGFFVLLVLLLILNIGGFIGSVFWFFFVIGCKNYKKRFFLKICLYICIL